MVRDTHQWALVAAALLEKNIKWLTCYVTCGQSGSHQHLGSCRIFDSCRRFQSTGCQKQVTSAVFCNGDSVKMCMHLPSPTWPRQQATLAKSSPERDMEVQELLSSTQTMEDMSDWSRLVEGDLRCPPPLTWSWRTSLEERCPHSEQKGEMVFGRNQCPNPPSITALNGMCGKLTRLTPQPGGQSCPWFPEKEMWKSFPGRSGPHLNCLRGRVMPRVPPMITLHLHPSMPRMWSVPTCLQHHIWQAGLPHEAATEDLGVCQSPAILSGESPVTTPGWTPLISGRCMGTVPGHGTFGHLHGCRGSRGWSTIQLVNDHPI